jgi:hypothetical protein
MKPSRTVIGPAALFMFASGLVTLVIWLTPLLSALVQGQPPALLNSSTTMVTDALDLGIITPHSDIRRLDTAPRGAGLPAGLCPART